MRITRVNVARFGLFHDPVELRFGPGINLVHGPNESGKSTLMLAIRHGLTLKSTITGAQLHRFKPRSHRGVPEVEIDFERHGVRYTVGKKFAEARGVTSLRRWRGESLEAELVGDEAEASLREILGVRETGRATERIDHLGIWPLVWIEQGHSAHIPTEALTKDARHTLSAYLARLSGTTLSGADHAGLEEAVQREYDKYFTKTGREARGAQSPLVAARKQAEEAKTWLESLEHRRDRHEQDVDRYVMLGDRIDKLRARLPDLQRQLDDTTRRLANVESLEKKIETARAHLEVLVSEKKRIEDRVAERGRRVERIAQLEVALQDARSALDVARKQFDEHMTRRQGLAQEQTRLEALAQVHGRRVAWVAATLDQVRAQSELAHLTQTLEEVHDYHRRILDADAKLESLLITDKDLKQLEKAVRRAEQARNALDAAAAGIHFRALKSVRVRKVGGEDQILAAGERHQEHVTLPTVFEIGDFIEIEVTPGGTDMGELRKSVESAERALRKRFDTLGVDSLEEARRRVQRAADLRTQRNAWAEFLKTRAPEGVDALERRLRTCRLTLNDATQRLEAQERPEGLALPDEEDDLSALHREWRREAEETDQAHQRARNRLSRHDLEIERLKGEVRMAEQHVGSLQAELKAAKDALAADREVHGQDTDLDERLLTATEELVEGERAIKSLEDDLARLDPERAKADKMRLTRAIEEGEADLRTAERERDTLEGATTAVDLVGLHERVDKARAEWERRRAMEVREEKRSAAVKLLYDVISEAKDAARRTYVRPLIGRVTPMLHILFGDATIRLSEDFGVQNLERQEAGQDTFESLSLGTREQLGVIMRLAMAQVLAGDGCLPVILDDALTASDDGRFDQMASVLTMAAQSLQLLIFTCHVDRYRVLGVPAEQCHDLAALRSAGSR